MLNIAGVVAADAALFISTAKINPVRKLYERFGFIVEEEDEYKVHMRYGKRLE